MSFKTIMVALREAQREIEATPRGRLTLEWTPERVKMSGPEPLRVYESVDEKPGRA